MSWDVLKKGQQTREFKRKGGRYDAIGRMGK